MNAVANRVEPTQGIAMMKPADLKEFRMRHDRLRENMSNARLNTESEEKKKTIEKTIRRTHPAALLVGRDLLWVHAGDRWRDNYGSWTAFCRSIDCPREYSYELMNKAAREDGVPPPTLKIAQEPESPPQAAAAAPAIAQDDGFQELRKAMEQGLEEDPDVPLDEAIAPKKEKEENTHSSILRGLTTVANQMTKIGMTDKAAILIAMKPDVEAHDPKNSAPAA